MGKDENQTAGSGGIQVFELTMDNPEDQDELNRRLRKPGEADHDILTKNSASSESKTGSTERPTEPESAEG